MDVTERAIAEQDGHVPHTCGIQVLSGVVDDVGVYVDHRDVPVLAYKRLSKSRVVTGAGPISKTRWPAWISSCSNIMVTIRGCDAALIAAPSAAILVETASSVYACCTEMSGGNSGPR